MQKWLVIILISFYAAAPAWAQNEIPETPVEEVLGEELAEVPTEPQPKPPVEKPQDTLADSPDNIPTETSASKREKVSHIPYAPFLWAQRPWRCWVDHLRDNYCLNLGLAYTSIYQHATEALLDQRGAGGDIDLTGHWHLFGGDCCCQAGYLGFRAEQRHRYTDKPPSDLGDSVGSLWPTVKGFNTQSLAMVELWWEHHLIKDLLGLRIGKIDTEDYFDSYRYRSANTGFINSAFSGNPTIPFPPAGFGMVFGCQVPDGLYLAAGFGDANAKKTAGVHTFFEYYQVFTALEIGWRPCFDGWGHGKYYLTLWHTDEVDTRPTLAKGDGFSIMAQQEFCRYVPFIRYSRSTALPSEEQQASLISPNGIPIETRELIIAGLGVEGPFCYPDDLFAFAIGWGTPQVRELRSQWTFETFYKIQLTPFAELTPDVQLVLRPSKYPSKNALWVFGLRLRVAI